VSGLEPEARGRDATLEFELVQPGPDRILFLADALRRAWSLDEIQGSPGSTRGSSISCWRLLEAEAALGKKTSR
jgi:hypothetical protein